MILHHAGHGQHTLGLMQQQYNTAAKSKQHTAAVTKTLQIAAQLHVVPYLDASLTSGNASGSEGCNPRSLVRHSWAFCSRVSAVGGADSLFVGDAALRFFSNMFFNMMTWDAADCYAGAERSHADLLQCA
jgi:hypothetical protein